MEDAWMDYLIKPEKTDAEANTFVIYIRDTYGIKDAVLLSKVVDRDKSLVLKWLDEKADNK
jgi:hypothetical protein